MIEQGDPDAEALVSEMAETEQVDADDILIGLGFALLRYTGQIDAEGRHWLEQAITRQRDRFGDTISEYDVLLTDLGSFDKPLLPAAVRAKPRLWLKIFPELAGSNVECPFSARWAMKLTRSIATDSAWAAWWAPSPFRVVELSLWHGSDKTSNRFGSNGPRLYFSRRWPIGPIDDGDTNGKAAWRTDMADALAAIGQYADLGVTPALPPRP